MGSVSEHLEGLRGDDRENAALELWNKYFHRLVGMARTRLRALPESKTDGEDVAICALKSFFRGADEGSFQALKDRDDLWRILVEITICKAADANRHFRRLKRDFQRERPLEPADSQAQTPAWFEGLASTEPTPAMAAELSEQVQIRLSQLTDERQVIVATQKMQGRSNREIADSIEVSVATVERILKSIRLAWC